MQSPQLERVRTSIPSARGFEEEPCSTLGFIDPNFDETRSRNVAMFIANVVRLTKTARERFIVLRQFREHVQRLDIFGVVIEHTLRPRDLSDRSERDAAKFSNALRDWIRHREKLFG